MEQRIEVKAFKVHLKCDECGNKEFGFMKPTGIVLSSNPLQYPHKCAYCDHIKNIRGKSYPYMEYQEIEGRGDE